MDSWLIKSIKENEEKNIDSFFQEVKKIQHDKQDAFLLFAQEGNLKYIQKFLTLGIDFAYEDDGWTALGIAAANGHLDVMKEMASKYSNLEDIKNELLKISGGTGFDDVFAYAPTPPVVELGDAILGFDGSLNFFAGPLDKKFSANFNFYNVH